MNENVSRNGILFMKEVSNVKGGKGESCSRRMKRERSGRVVMKIV